MADILPQQLLPGERVVWHGHPPIGLNLRPIEFFLIPFSLLWGGFAFFWNGLVWVKGAPILFNLFGLPFLVLGLYMIFGRFFVDAYIRRTMQYFVTDRRILILRSGWMGATKSMDIRRLPALELDERPDGCGTIRFSEQSGWMAGGGLAIWQPTLNSSRQFTRIPNARSVYELILKQSGS